jgi:hypothetical protein
VVDAEAEEKLIEAEEEERQAKVEAEVEAEGPTGDRGPGTDAGAEE